ncbi:DUF4097 family beta strand repeat-containing protein [Pseudofrankia sp. BMG5.37]|uniref:DUF4097 family beta strand repeat-containing protein n=1 Tax=Pseudofrankia sp. BMG5.37 TaxID=3050035 RepID=UPI002893A8D0|nr:DUF4097 family beta strand repeat-containing protein [Pseudofrankia sp. BMG5.37]MDT3442098.1 DUF4097 family beta strand repeat-containing protein [Pseudofrankia sp. BMG5.37]
MPELNQPEPAPPPPARPASEGDRTMAATADPTSTAASTATATTPAPASQPVPEPTQTSTSGTVTPEPAHTAATATTPPGGGGAGGRSLDDQPPAGGPRRARGVLLAIGVLLAAALAVGAGTQAVNLTTGEERRDEHLTLPASVDRLEVRASSGSLTLTGTPDDEAVVDAKLSGTVHPPALKVDIDGHTARVHADCSWQMLLSCETTLRLAVPAGVTVVARSSSGDIRAAGLTGSFDLHTSSGDVSSDGCSGTARLSTSSGDVRATRLGAATVYAHSSSGDVNVGLTVAATDVEATTSSGDVRVTVPLGSETYDATARTSSGSDSVRVATDPRSSRRIEARSSSGDVSIRYADAGEAS